MHIGNSQIQLSPHQTTIDGMPLKKTVENNAANSKERKEKYQPGTVDTSALKNAPHTAALKNAIMINEQLIKKAIDSDEHNTDLVAGRKSNATHSTHTKKGDYPLLQAPNKDTSCELLEKVTALVERFSGQIIWPFSQGSAEMKELFKSHNFHGGGICIALSALWIERRKNGDSLKNYFEKSEMADPNKVTTVIEASPELLEKRAAFDNRKAKEIAKNINSDKQPVNIDRIRQAMQFQVASGLHSGALIESNMGKAELMGLRNISNALDKMIRNGHGASKLENEELKQLRQALKEKRIEGQTNAMTNWLNAKGLKTVTAEELKATAQQVNESGETITSYQKLFREDMKMFDFSLEAAMALTTEARPDSKGETTYKQIGMWGNTGGHAMALALKNDGTVNFFDPNFGEISFNKKSDFIGWFVMYCNATRSTDTHYEIVNLIPQ